MRPRLTVVLLLAAVAIPIGVYLLLPHLPALGKVDEPASLVEASSPPADLLLTKSTLGRQPAGRPLVTNVKIVDLDRDATPDVLACDAALNRVVWYRQAPRGGWEERILGDADLPAPCHASAVDLDGDGDLDLVVAVLGSVYPTDEPIGKVAWLENTGREQFTTHILLDDLRRVSDVQAGDLNGDGKPDLAVAEFGYDRGRVLWLENRGEGRFRDRELLALPGAIHVPLADFNGDGDLDIAVVVSQEDEEVLAFENLGGGSFRRRSLHVDPNFDFGSSGLFAADLNKDGRPDLLLTGGDNLEITQPAPQPWHGCILLENKGGWKFEARRIGTAPGVYAAGAGDLDGDGHADVVLACMFNDWRRKGAASLVWLRNDGAGNFAARQLADAPTHLAAVAVGDLDDDGRADIVAGSLHILGPFDRLGRVTLWSSAKGGGP